jgi:CheY-like chemotaxis protein
MDSVPLLRVLVGDDNNNVRRIICLFLQSVNYQTIEARNGREAIDMARETKPDLVILDVMMPLVDGFTICRQLKRDPETREIPILICTAKSRKEDLITAIQAGAEDYITKPFTRENVLEKVEKVLAGRSMRTPPLLPRIDRRKGLRQRVPWKVSWGQLHQDGPDPNYKAVLQDISGKGFSFEFNRCDSCTGYQLGGVHPMCLFAPYAKNIAESEKVDFVFSDGDEVLFEALGKIVHVYQWEKNPKTEKVGVVFEDLPEGAREKIDAYLEEGNRKVPPFTRS